MNLGEFKGMLRDACKRGDSVDAKLDGYARRAARWVEQNFTLQYMRRRFTLQSVAADVQIDLPVNVPVKSIEYLRFTGTDGTRYECTKGELSDPEIDWTVQDRYGEWPSVNAARMPQHFYMDGVVSLVFDVPFPEALPGVGMMARYTDFPMKDTQTHWLLTNAEGLMLRQSLIEFMVDARDDRGYAAVKGQRDEDLKALSNADFEARWTGQDIQL